MERILINDTLYEEVPRPEKKRSSDMKAIAYMMAATLTATYGGGSGSKGQKPQVNIVEEFDLIQRKQSKLSRNDRDWVVYQFNRMYRKVE